MKILKAVSILLFINIVNFKVIFLVTFSPPQEEDPEYRSIVIATNSTLLLKNRETVLIPREEIEQEVVIYDEVYQANARYASINKTKKKTDESDYQNLNELVMESEQSDDNVSRLILASLLSDAQKTTDAIECQYDKLILGKTKDRTVEAKEDLFESNEEPIYANSLRRLAPKSPRENFQAIYLKMVVLIIL